MSAEAVAETTSEAPAPPVSAAVRVLRPILAVAIAVGSLAWAADLYRAVGLIFLTEQFLAAVLGTGLGLVFLHYPAKRETVRGRLPWYDALFALTGFGAGWYVAFAYPDLSTQMFALPTDGLVASAILYVLIVEGLRRSVGNSLVVLLVLFTAYALVGHLVPGALQTRKVELPRMILYLGIDTSGLFGLVMLVAVTVVIPFVWFGQLLFCSGGSGFFNELSLALMGRYRGGAAKISVTASGLFGSISGIVVSNILATGVVTIPLMKKSGYTARQAAAIEATASTGGQLMPPVMGAVAFLMADFLQLQYRDIVVAALVPSLLYYIALFIQADLEAVKMGITRVAEAEIPTLASALRTGWIFILPFVVLIYALFWLNREAEVSALWAALTVLGLGVLIGYKGSRMGWKAVLDSLIETGQSSLDILMISGAAGFIAGMLQTTGLGFALTVMLVKIGGGNVLALLVIAAVMCIVLGMGMPTLGVYVLLAVLVAPSLVELGFPPLAAHMFILYLGMMSFVTPPVAIAAFFAASLAGAEPMRTGFTAMRFGWTAYIVPFLFMFAPSLLLQGTSWTTTAIAIATAVSGIWLVSAGMVGYFLRRLSFLGRTAFIIAGLCLLVPVEIGGWARWTDVFGSVFGALLVAFEFVMKRRARVAPGPAQAS